MPTVYLKPDSGADIPLPDGGSSHYYFSMISNEMKKCLNSAGIRHKDSLEDSESLENPEDKKVKISLEINSEPGPLPSKNSGVYVFFSAGNPGSKRLAYIIGKNLENVYDDPSLITLMPLIPATAEIHTAPEVTLALGFANNPTDIIWLRENLEKIAHSMVMSLTEYFGVPYVPCGEPMVGTANSDATVTERPSLNSKIVKTLVPGEKVDVLNQWEDWYIVGDNNTLGYVQTRFITV